MRRSPPCDSRGIGAWTTITRTESEAGKAAVVIDLVPGRTDTRWWHADVAGRAAAWLLRGRLAFGVGGQLTPFPSAIAVWGRHQGLLSAHDHRLP